MIRVEVSVLVEEDGAHSFEWERGAAESGRAAGDGYGGGSILSALLAAGADITRTLELPAGLEVRVLREVRPCRRPGRGRWWRANGHGYTDRLELAGLYPAGHPDPDYSEVAASAALAQAAFQLEETVRRWCAQ